MRSVFLSLTVFCACLSPLLGQQPNAVPHLHERQAPTPKPAEGDVVALKSREGMLIIWNRSKPYFTMDVPGVDFVGYGPEAVCFKVDGVFFQLLSVEANAFMSDPSHATSEQILSAHRDWDFANMKRTLGEKSVVRSFPARLDDGTPVLYWEVKPEKQLSPAAPTRYLMVTRAFGGSVIGATSAEERQVSLDRAKTLVFRAIRGVRFSVAPADVARIQRELAAGN